MKCINTILTAFKHAEVLDNEPLPLERNNLPYFAAHEFKCKCGRCDKGVNEMQESTLQKLVKAREIANVPFVITSAVRCPEHNRNVGGVDNSAHTKGHAVDIAAPNSARAFLILDALLKVGFTRIGYSTRGKFFHVDDDPSLPQKVFFDY